MEKAERSLSQITFGYAATAISSVLSTGFWPGWMTGVPGKGGGTAGSLVGLLVQLALLEYAWQVPAAIAIATFAIGLAVVGPAERFMLAIWGPRLKHVGHEKVREDFNETCFDEFHAVFVYDAFFRLFPMTQEEHLALLFAGFVIFRVLDAKKPWPIGWIERRWHGTAFGIMVDDTVAAAITAGLLGFYFFLR